MHTMERGAKKNAMQPPGQPRLARRHPGGFKKFLIKRVAMSRRLGSFCGRMNIRAILFDLDDTLVVDEAVSRAAMEETARRAAASHGAEPAAFARAASGEAARLWAAGSAHAYCRRIGISAFECLWGNFEGMGEDLGRLRGWSREFRVRVFDAALRDQMLDLSEGEGEELAERFARERRKLQRLMPDARETLARLKPAFKLGLLTNGAPDLQREKLAASGLAPFFDAIAISGELGIGKPDAEIFHHLLGRLGVQAREAVMVGNSLERDIAGARNAGVLPVWIRVPGSEEHADAEPAETITGLAQLPEILGRHGGPG
jgi:putative hydrolase of the HAD superfamily